MNNFRYPKLAEKQGIWTDENGLLWPSPSPRWGFNYHNASHAALRSFVFRRDGFTCLRCKDSVTEKPAAYDGRYSLYTAKGRMLIPDHILSRKAGGLSHPDNLQTLCDPCNASKVAIDYRVRVAMGLT